MLPASRCVWRAISIWCKSSLSTNQKGLEYSLVWLPFIARFRKQDQAFYHDRDSFAAVLDLGEGRIALSWRKPSVWRRIYACCMWPLTRAVWHCSLGVAPLSTRRSDKTRQQRFFITAPLGRLLQDGEPMDAAGLTARLQALCHDDIALCIPRYHGPDTVAGAGKTRYRRFRRGRLNAGE